MTAKTRERVTYVVVSTLILAGTALYARQWDLTHQLERYQQSEQATKDMKDALKQKEEELAAAQQRAQDMDKDPVEKEATVRRVSKGVREDEIVYRIEEETPPAQQ
jgi:cell division protein FtsB